MVNFRVSSSCKKSEVRSQQSAVSREQEERRSIKEVVSSKIPHEKTEKTDVIQESEEKKGPSEKKPEFGTGISAAQIEEIIRDFRK